MLARYALAVALAPLMAASGAIAQVVISTTQTTPVVTSTALGGGDLRIEEDGAIELSSGVAITRDSTSQVVMDEGSVIQFEDAADGSTGILLRGGHAGALVVGGVISITDTLDETEDEDEDGDGDGPFATGTGRYGIRVAGEGDQIGDITIEDTGSVYVEGNQSYGVSVETDVIGDIDILGGVTALGTDVFGVRLAGDVSGSVLLSGSSVSANGANAVGLSTEGRIGGRLQIQSTVTSNGFRYTSAPTSVSDLEEEERDDVDLADDTLYLEDLDADDLLQGGSAVVIAGDVAGGVLLGAIPTYAAGGGDEDDADRDGVEDGEEDDDGDGIKNEDDEDLDGDGIPDENEGTASLTSYGSAPALVLGAVGRDVAIGAVGQGDDAFGLINEGSISAVGVYDGLEAVAVSIGVAGGGAVRIDGGIRNDNTISASSSEASSTAIRISAGAVATMLRSDGLIQAVATTEGVHAATGVLVEAGGSLQSIVNSGTIAGVVYGEAGDAIAVRDLSGSLTRVENTGSIYASLIATDDLNDLDDDNEDQEDEVETGRSIALDLSAATAGVTIVQRSESDQHLTDTDGDDVYDDEDTDDDGDGVLDPDDDDDNDNDNDGVYNYDEALISGDILLGAGDDHLDVRNGSVVGDVTFGSGQDRLSLTGSAVLRGALADADGRLDILVEGATLDARQNSALAVSSLTVGRGGELVVSIDPTAGTAGGFLVSGAATFADTSAVGVRLTSLVDQNRRFTIVSAGNLSYGSASSRLSDETAPYLVVADFTVDRAANALNIDIRRRTPEEMSLSGVETSAYDAFYAALSRDDDVRDAFLAIETREDFLNLYEQSLPDHSGGTLQSLASGVDAVTRALVGRNAVLSPGEVSGWVQEINFYADKDKTETYGFRSEGFGVAGGYERGMGAGVIGTSFAITSSDLQDPESEAEEMLSATLVEMGLYWRAQGRGWTAWSRAAAGYASFHSIRTLVDENLQVETEADWSGYSLSAAGGLAFEHRFGRLTVRPEAYAEVFALHEGSRREQGGGDSIDLEVASRDGALANAVALLNLGYSFGADDWIRPELRLGWKQALSYDPGDTVARYLSGGEAFVLAGETVSGGGPLFGFSLNLGNAMARLTVAADAQLLEDYVRYSLLLRASYRF